MMISVEGEGPGERDKWPCTNYKGVKIGTKTKEYFIGWLLQLKEKIPTYIERVISCIVVNYQGVNFFTNTNFS